MELSEYELRIVTGIIDDTIEELEQDMCTLRQRDNLNKIESEQGLTALPLCSSEYCAFYSAEGKYLVALVDRNFNPISIVFEGSETQVVQYMIDLMNNTVN